MTHVCLRTSPLGTATVKINTINKPSEKGTFQFQDISNFHSGQRIQKVTDLFAEFTGYVWTEAVSGEKKLRIQKYPDTSGRGFREVPLPE